jgi:hypothetical protein
MEIGPTIYHNRKSPVNLEAFADRYVRTFNKYPSKKDFQFQIELFNKQVM